MSQRRLILAGLLATAVMSPVASQAATETLGPGTIGAVNVPPDTTVTLVGGTTVNSSTFVPLGAPYGNLSTAIMANGAGRAVILDTSASQPGQASFANHPITLAPSNASGVIVSGGSAVIDPGKSGVVLAFGNAQYGFLAIDGGTITIKGGGNGTSLIATGAPTALFASSAIGKTSTIDATGMFIDLSGPAGGVIVGADPGGSVTLRGGSSISAAGAESIAFAAAGTGTVTLTDKTTPVTLGGANSVGVYALAGGKVALPDGMAMTFNGAGSNGVVVDGARSDGTTRGGALKTIGSGLTLNFNGASTTKSSTGLVALRGGNLAIQSVTITGRNAGIGAWATSGGQIRLSGNSIIDVTAGSGKPVYRSLQDLLNAKTVPTSFRQGGLTTLLSDVAAANPAGLFASSTNTVVAGTTTATGAGVIFSEGTTINVAGPAALSGSAAPLAYGMAVTSDAGIVFSHNTVNATGPRAVGLGIVSGGAIKGNALINGKNSRITVDNTGGAKGAQAALVRVESFHNLGGTALVSLKNVQALAQGAGASGLVIAGDNSAPTGVLIDGGSFVSKQSAAITGYSDLAAHFIDGAQVAGGKYLVLAKNKVATHFDITADGASMLSGDARALPGAVVNVSLADNSVWTGAAQNLGDVSLNDSSWNISDALNGNSPVSDVGSLSLTGSTVAFNAPRGNRFNSLTVRGGYASNDSGNTLILHTVLNAGGALSNQFTDRLLIDGSATGQPTNIVVVGAGTAGSYAPASAPGAGTGISLVQVAGSSSAGAFGLKDLLNVVGTPFKYQLNAYGPGSPNGLADAGQSLVGGAPGQQHWDYRLQNVYVDAGGVVNPPGASAGSSRAEVLPQIPSYLSAARALFQAGLTDLDSLHQRLGEIRDDQILGRGEDAETFVRVYGARLNYSTDKSFVDYGYNFSSQYDAVQFGANYKVVNDEDGTLRLGLAGILGQLDFTPSAVDGASHGSFDTEQIAGTVNYQARAGWYVDGVLATGWFDGHVTAPNFRQGLDGTNVALSVETGMPFALDTWDLSVEPQAQLIWQHLDFTRHTDASGIGVDLGSPDQVTARFGARLLRPFHTEDDATLLTPYLKANLLQGIDGGSTVAFANVPFETGGSGTVLQFGAGMTGTLNERLSVYSDVSWQSDVSGAGARGWVYNVGFRIALGDASAPAEAAPFAPPPPAQTAAAHSFLVFFDWNKDALTPDGAKIVAEAAAQAARGQYTRIDVTGYTDTSGSAAYNIGLSMRRARAVAAELKNDGVQSSAIVERGAGATNPLVPTGDNVREPQNRRVEIVTR